MADGVFGVEVVTPEQSLYAGGARSVVLATSDGALTVLDGHTPLVGDIVPCELKLDQPEGPELRFAVHGGFLQVDTSPGAAEGLAEGELLRLAVHGGFLQVDTSPHAAEGLADEGDGPLPGLSTRVTVLAGIAELSEEIDVARAEQARDAANQRVNELQSGRGGEEVEVDLELLEAQGSFERAELRLSVAAGEA